MPGAKTGKVPIMRMFGSTKGGQSVCCHVHGFHPYFFVPAPDKFGKQHLAAFRSSLNNAVVNDMKNNRDQIVDAVLDVCLLMRSSIYGFQVNIQAWSHQCSQMSQCRKEHFVGLFWDMY